jgi:hypothetical protein
MSTVPGFPIGPWPLGIDNVSAPSRLKSDPKTGAFRALVDAISVDIDRDGRPARRAGWAQAVALAGMNSLWSCPLGAFAAAGTTLYSVSAGAVQAIGTLGSADPCAYAVLNDSVVVANRTTLLQVRAGTVTPLGVSDAPAPIVAAGAAGGLDAGTYGVAVSFLRAGQEGGLSNLRMVNVDQGGGIVLTGLPSAADADSLRVYVTHANGETLYRCADLPLGLPSYIVGVGLRGVIATTQWLRRMPPGELVASWRGRLLVAHNRTLYVSRPMNYGLYSPRHGFVQFPSRITMIAAVEAGVWVGTKHGIVFLRGPRPSEWQQESTGALPPIPGAVTGVDSAVLALEGVAGGLDCALWLAPNGFVVGTPDGQIIEPQSDRIKIAAYSKGAVLVDNRRVTACVA